MEYIKKSLDLRKLIVQKPFLEGSFSLTEQQIIEFAKKFDPLPFHINKKTAQASIFKTLVASGPHPFMYVYKKFFLAKVKFTILAGLGIDNWRFFKPVCPNENIIFKIIPSKIELHKEKSSATIKWHVDFLKNNEIIQVLDTYILHRVLM